jgi:hypothetical protein
MIKTLENLDAYRTGVRGSPRLNEEMAWHATNDDRVLGIIVREIRQVVWNRSRYNRQSRHSVEPRSATQVEKGDGREPQQ